MRGDPTIDILSQGPQVKLTPITNWQDLGIIWTIQQKSAGEYFIKCKAPGLYDYLSAATVNSGVSRARLEDWATSLETWQATPYASDNTGGYQYILQQGSLLTIADTVKLDVKLDRNLPPSVWTVGRYRITSAELVGVVTSTVSSALLNPDAIFQFLNNAVYQPLSTAQVNSFYATDPYPNPAISKGANYSAEEYDCNAFSRTFQAHVLQAFYDANPSNTAGPAFGFAAVVLKTGAPPGHSVNFYITPQLKLVFVDPQTGAECLLSTITSIQCLII